eukprot:TRINITY_DN2883_c0_g1_i1.p1 TRINITY_DN2883_c0_g1~~TRINITY_DN2883_c0_g1_i1.p1  ORF type:complete len:621 (-),score=131.11 TRINITY_DN2883_c0_g1_i1:100-1962(-)
MHLEQTFEKVYFVTGLFSLFGALLIIGTFLGISEVRKKRFNQIIFLIGVCDFIFNTKYLLVAILGQELEEEDKGWCLYSVIVGQFFGVASISWNMIVSLSLIITIRNPFSQYGKYNKFFHIYAWTVSLISTIIVVATNNYGESFDGTCGIKGDDNPMRLLFFVPLFAAFIFAIASLIYSLRTFTRGLGESQQFRRGHFVRQTLYVLIFIVFWSGPFILKISQYAHKDNPIIKYFSAVGVSGQAFMNALVWLTHPSIYAPFCRKWNKKKNRTPGSQRELEEAALIGKYNENLETLLRFELLKNILVGICDSSGRNASADHSVKLALEYFESTERRVNSEESSSTNFLFSEHAPKVFRKLRESQGITEKQFSDSMNPGQLQKNFSEYSFSGGRSGSFFWISTDQKYVIKSVRKHEYQCLQKILYRYYQYLHNKPTSYITKFYGLYAIQLKNIKKIRFVVMDNVFCTTAHITAKYDIKGSWIDRKSEAHKSVKMDQDFDKTIVLPAKIARNVTQQLQRDVEFLESVQVMDYSLLIGVCDGQNAPRSPRLFGERSKDKGLESHTGEKFYLGIVDILQLYNLNKKSEHLAKVYVLRKDKEGVSAVNPAKYAERFMKKIRQIFEEH